MIQNSRILWSMLKTQNVTISVTRQPDNIFLLYQVGQSIDLGHNRQHLFLQPVGRCATPSRRKPLIPPSKLGAMQITYAGASCRAVADIYEAIVAVKGRACIEKIVPDVLSPGDFVSFRITADRQVRFVEALRSMTVKQLMNAKPSRIAHAL